MNQAVAIVLAYLLGSIPFAYLAGLARGVDIRTVGSKNVGATNVFRTLGKRIGIAVMLLDIGFAEYLAQRRAMMQEWSDYLDKLRDSVASKVVPIRAA